MSLEASSEVAAPTAVRATDAKLVASASRLTSSTGVTNVVNIVSGSGRVREIHLRVKVVPDGAPTLLLEQEVDGQTQVDEPIYTAANLWSDVLRVLAENRDGNTIGHTVRYGADPCRDGVPDKPSDRPEDDGSGNRRGD